MFKKILIPVDMQDSSFAKQAVSVGIDQAQKHDAELHIMTVVPDFGMPVVSSYFPESAMQEALEVVEKELEKFVADNVPADIDGSISIRSGSPYKEILDEAKKREIDLIVIPSHDTAKGFEKVLMGSVASQVVKAAHISVLVLRHPGE